MAQLKYPIGIQDFREIREDAFHNIDQAKLIYAHAPPPPTFQP